MTLREQVEALHQEEWRSCNGNCHDTTLDAVLDLIDAHVAEDEELILAWAGLGRLDPERLTRALVEVEEQKRSEHPECLNDTCDHDECPDWAALGCGDAAAIVAAYEEQG